MQNRTSILAEKVQNAPAIPQVIIKALNIMKDEESSMRDLSEVMSYDQSLTTKVLALVNSAYYGFPQQITSITRAITLLGMMKAKNIIVAVAMQPMLCGKNDKDLWEHSIRVAVGCEYLAAQLKMVDEDEAFVAGFLHDIGKIAFTKDDYQMMDKVTELVSTGSNILEVENILFNTNHADLGAALAKKWKLPVLLINAIKYHHNPAVSSMPLICLIVQTVNELLNDPEFVPDESLNIQDTRALRDAIMQKSNSLLLELLS